MFVATLDPLKVGKIVAFFQKAKRIVSGGGQRTCGYRQNHLSAIERGERKPTLETLYRICSALSIKMSTFILN